eukprot:19600-Heterococcus_DN1.PRE.1
MCGVLFLYVAVLCLLRLAKDDHLLSKALIFSAMTGICHMATSTLWSRRTDCNRADSYAASTDCSQQHDDVARALTRTKRTSQRHQPFNQRGAGTSTTRGNEQAQFSADLFLLLMHWTVVKSLQPSQSERTLRCRATLINTSWRY